MPVTKGCAAIAGAGLMGRLMALQLLRRGWSIELFDTDTRAGRKSAAYIGAGMLAPFCELESGKPIICELGRNAVAEWKQTIATLAKPVELGENGTLVVAHRADRAELTRLERCTGGYGERLDTWGIRELEPQLDGFQVGLLFRDEGQVNNRQLLLALEHTLAAHPRLQWHEKAFSGGPYDLRLDCRGLGARGDDRELRGVRGELLYVRAPEVHLRRPVRLMHPRYPLYVVPRSGHVFVIGATQIESDSVRGITVRSALELLSALYSLHSGFAEAEVIETAVGCRPAYPDNLPRITISGASIRINGLYRHGYLLGPRVSDVVCRIVEGKALNSYETQIVRRLT